MTYGRQHLAFWLKEENGTLTRQDPLSAVRTPVAHFYDIIHGTNSQQIQSIEP